LKNSLSPEDQETYGLIKDKAVDNTFALLEFSRSNYDFKAMINGSEVFVVYAGKIKAKN
jgi:hypothetical protein